MIRKVLRTLLLIYVIRVFTIQELRCTSSNILTLESVIGRLTNFEISNFDNYTLATIESSFKSQLILRKRKDKHVKSDSDTFYNELDELEALIAKIFGRGRGKYKGKLPIIYFFVQQGLSYSCKVS